MTGQTTNNNRPENHTEQDEAVAPIRSKWALWWKYWTDGLSFGPVFVLLSATVLLIIYHENGSPLFFTLHFKKYFDQSVYKGLYPAFYWYSMCLLLLGIIPLLLGRYVLKVPIKNWIGLGDVRFGLVAVPVLYLAFLIILIPFSLSGEFQSKYPLFFEAKQSAVHFVLYEMAYAIYFIGWEFVFRGYMLFGLKPAIGYYAVFVQTIPFAILHFGKPEMETLAAVAAGVILGYLALRARSFWYGWILHALIAVTNDIIAAWQTLLK